MPGGTQSVIGSGAKLLKKGKSAQDAVEAAIRAMEDSSRFNAGKGAQFNEAGEHEFNTSIMDGKTMKNGAAGAFKLVKNSITLARKIMDEAKNAFLSGPYSEDFCPGKKLDMEPMPYFSTPMRMDEWLEARKDKRYSYL